MAKVILVVDDEPIIVEISKRKLEELGYEVIIALDGEEALEQLAKKIPDLILLDVAMPKMNGYTFMMEKNKVDAYAKVPMIILSAHCETEPLFTHHGLRAQLAKPLKMQEVLDKVVEIIGPA